MRIFLTGGSRGIGASLVKALAQAGHDVAFTYQTAQDSAGAVVAETRALAPERRCRAWQLDVRDPARVESVGEEVVEAYGGIDAVINNAGIVRVGVAATMPDEDWDDVIATNLSGAFYVSRFFLNEFLINGHGRFVHISSIARTGLSGQISYCASKAGLDGLSATLAKEYGRKNVTSNVLCLGFFDTDMSQNEASADFVKFWDDYCPVGRIGRLSEIAAAVLLLLSDEGGFINGQTINLSGGLDWIK